jgi:hypothetical protein
MGYSSSPGIGRSFAPFTAPSEQYSAACQPQRDTRRVSLRSWRHARSESKPNRKVGLCVGRPPRPPNLTPRFLSAPLCCCRCRCKPHPQSLLSSHLSAFTDDTLSSSPYPLPSSLPILALPRNILLTPVLRLCKLHTPALCAARTTTIFAGEGPHG